MVIVDTSVWIEFLRNADSNITSHLKQLLRSGKVAITGMILAEILQGIKNPKEADTVKKGLESLPFIGMQKEMWQLAGETSALLRKKGITIPLSDIITGVIAGMEKYEIYTLDSHFEKIPDVILHNPE